MSVNKTRLIIAVILLSFNLNSNSQSTRRDLSEADLDWNWPKDSAQRIKPLTPGAYNVKTTQNGCISAISSTYYFLVTDILKLSSTEFIKLAPNPFQTKLNFDFLIKGYQKMNLDVFEISTGNRVASRIGLMPGAPIFLPELTGGTYIIRITSADGKLSYQFKMVKM